VQYYGVVVAGVLVSFIPPVFSDLFSYMSHANRVCKTSPGRIGTAILYDGNMDASPFNGEIQDKVL
jgi:hypothetical protein